MRADSTRPSFAEISEERAFQQTEALENEADAQQLGAVGASGRPHAQSIEAARELRHQFLLQ